MPRSDSRKDQPLPRVTLIHVETAEGGCRLRKALEIILAAASEAHRDAAPNEEPAAEDGGPDKHEQPRPERRSSDDQS